VRAARRQYLSSRAQKAYIKARVDAEYDIAVAKTPSPDTEPASDAYAMKKTWQFTYANPRRKKKCIHVRSTSVEDSCRRSSERLSPARPPVVEVSCDVLWV